MQPFDTNKPVSDPEPSQMVNAGPTAELLPGSAKTIALPDGRELALYNIESEFYATENFCPHKGAPLANGLICGHVVECDWHGWQFDVRTGVCLTVPERIETYTVIIEAGSIKIMI
jgi:nitrite reductase/ring-hydroxylating ferredoxin subunit